MSVEDYFKRWLNVINKNELYRLVYILDKLYKSKSVCPSQNNIFKAFKLCKYDDCKIVMCGYDPYPQKGVATGVLFGNNASTKEENLSPSLKIIKNAAINLHIPHNITTFDPTLESWAKQGILMLNSALTVEEGKTGSHSMLWRPFMSKFIENFSSLNPNIIYVLFGEQAGTFTPYIKNGIKLYERHPSYYARVGKDMQPDIFYRINNEIYKEYGYRIKWYEEE